MSRGEPRAGIVFEHRSKFCNQTRERFIMCGQGLLRSASSFSVKSFHKVPGMFRCSPQDLFDGRPDCPRIAPHTGSAGSAIEPEQEES